MTSPDTVPAHYIDTWLACGRGCVGKLNPFETRYRCPTCGGLLEVRHDVDALARTDARLWRQRFDNRSPTRAGWDASGIWAKREWVLPGVAPEEAVTLGEGYSSLTFAPSLAKEIGVGELWVKQCGVAHTGSFKDLGMTVLVTQVVRMRNRGAPIRAVVCASTGDTSAALAAYAAAAGLPAVILLPRSKVTTAQLVQPLANGALVLALDTDFDGCMRIVQEIASDPTLYLANSMNPWRLEGQKTVAMEIVQQLGWEAPDFIALPGGNLGNTAAVGMGLELVERLADVPRKTKLLVGQVERANPLYLSSLRNFEEATTMQAGETAATAIRIGAPVSFERAVKALRRCGGYVTQATEDELADAAALADRHGQYLCPQSAAALAGIRQAAADGRITSKDRVVLVSTAHGLKFTEFKVRYHEGSLPDVVSRFRNEPVVLDPSVDAVRQAVAKRFEAKR
jgi:threonine synthase